MSPSGDHGPARRHARRTRRAAAPTRNRAETERAILESVGAVLATDGFAALGVNAVARAAGIDKVLLYRYFGGLPQLLRAYGERGAFWPSVQEIVGSDPAALRAQPVAERFAVFFDRFVDALRARPLTVEILALETVEDNELTRVLDTVRETWSQQVAAALGLANGADASRLTALAALVVAGAQYLVIRSRRSPSFAGIEIASDSGWDLLKAAVRAVGRHGLASAAAPRGRR